MQFIIGTVSVLILVLAGAAAALFLRARSGAVRAKAAESLHDITSGVLRTPEIVSPTVIVKRSSRVAFGTATVDATGQLWIDGATPIGLSEGDSARLLGYPGGGRANAINDAETLVLQKCSRQGVTVGPDFAIEFYASRFVADGRPELLPDRSAEANRTARSTPVTDLLPPTEVIALGAPLPTFDPTVTNPVSGPPSRPSRGKRGGTRHAGKSGPWGGSRSRPVPPPAGVELVDLGGGPSRPISHTKSIIGRFGADIDVNDDLVSAPHAQLSFLKDEWTIADLASTNGLWINGTRVTRTTLLPGDIITFAADEGPRLMFAAAQAATSDEA
jgi:hypothetical protein